MKKTGIFYGSSTGTTEEIAKRIGSKLGIETSDIHNIDSTDVNKVSDYELLVLGSSTWGVGDLQDDWEGFLPKLKKLDLSTKTVAIFGTGDSSSFGDSFCDAMGTIYNELKDTGCKFIGAIPLDGYSFEGSTAVIDGKLIGLALDEVNESNLTDKRIAQWVNQLTMDN